VGPKCYAVQCIVSGKKTPKIAPSPWDSVTPSEKDRATATGNMRKNLGKDRACGSRDILADRQTDTDTLITGEVIIALTQPTIPLRPVNIWRTLVE